MPRNGGLTRTKLLDVAERLAIEYGFSATSIDRVIAESQSSKGAFFHHFSSKADLARALVDRYADADIAHLTGALDAIRELPSARERLLGFVAYFVDEADDLMAAQASCLYVAALTEQELISLGTTASIDRAIVAWRDAISGLVEDALAESDREPTDFDVEALADHVFVTFEGSFILCRATTDPSHMRRQLTVLHRLFEGLLT